MNITVASVGEATNRSRIAVALAAGAMCLALSENGMTQSAPNAAPNEGRQAAGPELKIENALVYSESGGAKLTLDLYRVLPTAAPVPVVIWVHGASGALTSSAATPAAALATVGGYAIASVEYRTMPGASLAMQLADIKAAVRWVRANAATYNLDAAHIGVMGYDRGAQLAALIGTTGDVAALEGSGGSPGQSSRVQAVIDLAGAVASGEIKAISYVTADDAPTLIFHGSADSRTATDESQSFISALKVSGVNATLEMPFAVSHELGELLSPIAMQSVTAFFNQHLKGVPVVAVLSSFMATPAGTYVDPIALDLAGTQYKLYATPVRGSNTNASYRIYLPPDYQSNTRRRYPVVYFLHGRSVDSKRPLTAGYIARVDAAIRNGAMPPMIVVLAQGLTTGWYVDSEDGKYPMESVIIKNLIPHIDATYRTIARRDARAIEGHSMGGFGALHIGFKYPELFAAATGNAPALVEKNSDGVGSEAFWERESVGTLARKNADQLRRQKIRIIVGDKDGLFPVGKKLDEQLTELKVAHGFFPVAGSPHNHDQLLQYESFDTMAFYREVFGPLKN